MHETYLIKLLLYELVISKHIVVPTTQNQYDKMYRVGVFYNLFYLMIKAWSYIILDFLEKRKVLPMLFLLF